jgi:hypothetical protein
MIYFHISSMLYVCVFYITQVLPNITRRDRQQIDIMFIDPKVVIFDDDALYHQKCKRCLPFIIMLLPSTTLQDHPPK